MTVTRNMGLLVADFAAAFAVMVALGKENFIVVLCGLDTLLYVVHFVLK